MKKYLAICVMAVLATSQAHAVRLGTDVSEQDYRDYIVRLQVADTGGSTSSCGGLLVAGEYIITAGHCVGDYNYNGTNAEYLYWVNNGANNAITVSQGIAYTGNKITNTTYQVIDFINLDQVRDTAYIEGDAVKLANAANGFDWSLHDARYDATYTQGAFHYDIALLKLNKTISQTSHAAITPVYDNVNSAFNVAAEDTFTFRGWGRDENGQRPTTMQETQITWGSTNATWLSNNSYIPNMPRINPNITECSNAGDLCTYGMLDFAKLFPVTIGGTPSQGDSGTPLEKSPNHVIGLAKSEHSAAVPEYVDFTHFGWYLPSIAAQINKVVAPSGMDFTFGKSDTANKTHTFAVQNLSSNAETLAPYLTGDTDRFEVAGCNKLLAPTESCEVTIIAKPQASNAPTVLSTSNSANVTLFLGDTNDTSLPISLSETGTGGESGNGGAVGGNDDSGGSTGIISLLVLLGLICNRKNS